MRGGLNIIPEFIALGWALATYTGAFIAEIVRSGIQAVNKGQTEASCTSFAQWSHVATGDSPQPCA